MASLARASGAVGAALAVGLIAYLVLATREALAGSDLPLYLAAALGAGAGVAGWNLLRRAGM